MQLAILGRQSKISLAELESVFGASHITPVGADAALVHTEQPLPQPRLGGTMKSAKVLTKLQDTDLSEAFTYLQTMIPEHLHYLPKGKLQLGVSVYGFKAQRDWLLKQMLGLKKIIKETGQSVRIIENKSEVLESAQILYNKLTGPLGWELLLVRDGNDVIVAQTTAVQDIDDYAKRDFGRPMRDAFVGMLPPKLAQIMLNLANISENQTVLDPFCGTGVVLQEALLAGNPVYGTDLSEKMIRYTRDNLNWLQETYSVKQPWYLEVADATSHQWRAPIDVVVCETYLGTPLTALPQHAKLTEIVNEANQIAEMFLDNLQSQLEKGTRLTVALPAWYLGGDKFLHLPLLDRLTDLGYNRLEFVHAQTSELVYHRSDQIVARELTILEKK